MYILNLKDKKEKNYNNRDNIWHSFGAIEGTLICYQRQMLTAERALDDIKDIIEEYNLLKTKVNE